MPSLLQVISFANPISQVLPLCVFRLQQMQMLCRMLQILPQFVDQLQERTVMMRLNKLAVTALEAQYISAINVFI